MSILAYNSRVQVIIAEKPWWQGLEKVGFATSPVKKLKKMNAGTPPDSYVFMRSDTPSQGMVSPTLRVTLPPLLV